MKTASESRRKTVKPIVKVEYDSRPYKPCGIEGRNIPVGGGCAYRGIQLLLSADFGKGRGKYLVGTCQAFDVFGLVGSEQNGVFVLNETMGLVVLDRHCEQNTGYFGASAEQFAEAERIAHLDWDDFKAFVGEHPRSRFSIEEE